MANHRPPPGTMVYWRFKTSEPRPYRFGYCTYESGHNLVRMGSYNGDRMGGSIVDINEVEWKPYGAQYGT